ncbi:MAG: hypothetical protein HQL28_03180 [Candidatus Omnitrophica bacterium]|nr:hypothetical protein [Candidatus Omnitrophota bacterium]
MKNRALRDLGKQFYEWQKSGACEFEYGGDSKDLNLEVERITKLIDYLEAKKEALSK